MITKRQLFLAVQTQKRVCGRPLQQIQTVDSAQNFENQPADASESSQDKRYAVSRD